MAISVTPDANEVHAPPLSGGFREYRTIVADWESVDGVSVALRPVVVTVPAATPEEAIEAASDRLQEHFGSNVAELGYEDIERDWWFGLNEADAFLRVCAVFVGAPILDNGDQMTTEIHGLAPAESVVPLRGVHGLRRAVPCSPHTITLEV